MHAVHKIDFVNMSEDFDREDDLEFLVVVALLSMQGQKALGFHQKYLNLYSKDK